MEDDKRSTPRHRVLKAATISFGGGAISCTVRNLSVSGASLDVASPIGIPDAIVLEVEGVRRQCRVIWRTERRIGVRFGDANDKAKPASVPGGKPRDR
ncbi:MAG: PilZ domain-containing protein [Bradyrhizobiaceae bacterium]|nr:MAG: PilZ domain-containing protein [Bradyrhizobiaceae bacterium]